MGSRVVLVLGVAAAVFVFSAGSAKAGTASVESQPSPEGDVVQYVADAGETNRVSITWTFDPKLAVLIEDEAAPVTAGPGCTSLTPNRASCTYNFVLAVKLGDGNDTLTIADDIEYDLGIYRAGPGNDRITGGRGFVDSREFFFGGAGDDRLRGGPGRDIFNGGLGADDFGGGSSGVCFLAGVCVADDDTVTYASRTEDVFADADGIADDGEVGEGDRIRRSIEVLVGGSGDDVLGGLTTNVESIETSRLLDGMSLIGRRGNDILRGGRARDSLSGGPGSDVLRGGKRRDFARGQEGNDALFGDSGRDQLSGGSGHDRLIGGSGADRLFGGKGRDTLRARDGQRDLVNGGRWHDRARVDAALDRIRNVETLL